MVLGLISLVLVVLGWIIWIFAESMTFPIILAIVGIAIGVFDLFKLWKQEKLLFQDFVKEAFRTNWASSMAIVGGLSLLISSIYVAATVSSIM